MLIVAVMSIMFTMNTFASSATSSGSSYTNIPNGMYTISTALKSSMVMDVYGSYSANGTNVQLYKSGGQNNQKFNIVQVSSGWYKIINVATDKAIEVAGGVKKSGANVQLYQYNGKNAQLWRFISAGSGYYYIQNKLGYYLDVYGSNTSNKTNILVYQFHGKNNQKWKLNIASNYTNIQNGMYTMNTALKSSMVMDVYGSYSANGTNVQLYQSSGENNQKFNITAVGSGWYKIINVATNKSIDVAGGGKNGANVQLYKYNGNDAQLWRFISAGNGYYYIQNKFGHYLDVYGSQTSNGTNILVYQFHGGNNQKWRLNKTSEKVINQTYYVTTTAGLTLRKSASTNSSKLALMPYGAAIQVTAISNGWAKCTYNGMSGYCSSEYISKSKPSGTEKLSYSLYKNARAYISCKFDGYTTTRGRHEGIDIVCSLNAPVYSLTSGEVVRVQKGYNGSSGLSTIAIYDSSANKTVIYLHSNPLGLKAGQKISKGQQIATQGWRGCSSSGGSHTHVEVRNGRQGYAAKSVGDYKLDNPNPTSYWTSKGYIIQ